ncbi:MAG TPA: calcium-binding protein, partial [Catenuloplanes sp.]
MLHPTIGGTVRRATLGACLSLGAVAVTALGGAGAARAAAPAGQVYLLDGTLFFTAQPDAANRLTLTTGLDGTVLRDLGAPIDVDPSRPDEGCVRLDPHAVRCPRPEFAVQIRLGAGADTFDNDSELHTYAFGGDGDDRLSAVAPAQNHFNGEGGADVLAGNLGPDFLDGGPGDDRITGGGHNDQLTDGPGDDRVRGDDGDDELYTGLGADDLDGGPGVDTARYDWEHPAVTVTLDGQANDGAAGEADNVRATVEGLHGTSGADTLTGNGAANTLVGWGGADRLRGLGGADTLESGDGADWLSGGDGDDHLHGGSDNDTLYGDAGADQLVGGFENDTSYGGAGADTINASFGDDVAWGQGGNDTLTGFAGTVRLHGGDGDDVLTGHEGDDVLRGDGGNDTLVGLGGNDTLHGGNGDDDLNASEGTAQRDYGDAGTDRCLGENLIVRQG